MADNSNGAEQICEECHNTLFFRFVGIVSALFFFSFLCSLDLWLWRTQNSIKWFRCFKNTLCLFLLLFFRTSGITCHGFICKIFNTRRIGKERRKKQRRRSVVWLFGMLWVLGCKNVKQTRTTAQGKHIFRWTQFQQAIWGAHNTHTNTLAKAQKKRTKCVFFIVSGNVQ